MDNNHYCVIMAGGNGSRLWPASTTACPKQFMDIAETGKTSIRNTYDRFSSIVPKDNILVVTVRKYRDLVLRDIPELKEENLLLEPYARDTAPCIAYAAYTLFKRNPQATMVVTPADHLIDDDEKFREAIVRSIEFVSENNVLMTLGITPTRPDPNFGYIQITGGSAALQKAGAIKVSDGGRIHQQGIYGLCEDIHRLRCDGKDRQGMALSGRFRMVGCRDLGISVRMYRGKGHERKHLQYGQDTYRGQP